MADIGRGPLRFLKNRVHCGCCDAELPGSTAGARIVAHHSGPELVRVVIDGRAGKVVHDCDVQPPKAADDTGEF